MTTTQLKLVCPGTAETQVYKCYSPPPQFLGKRIQTNKVQSKNGEYFENL